MSIRQRAAAVAFAFLLSGCQFSGPTSTAQGGPPGAPGAGSPSPAGPPITAGSPKNAVQSPGPPQGSSRRPGTPEDVLYVDADVATGEKPDLVEKIETPDGPVELYGYKDFNVSLTIDGETYDMPVLFDEKGHMSVNLKMPSKYTEYETVERIEFTRPGFQPVVLENVRLSDGMVTLPPVELQKG